MYVEQKEKRSKVWCLGFLIFRDHGDREIEKYKLMLVLSYRRVQYPRYKKMSLVKGKINSIILGYIFIANDDRF